MLLEGEQKGFPAVSPIPSSSRGAVGQKKPVRVFRLISESTIEEKIVERAEKKLFLGAGRQSAWRLLFTALLR